MVSKSKRIPKLTLGMRMLIAMHSAGYSTGEMAKKLDVSRHSATGWVYGRHQPNRATLKQWAEDCDVDFDWLVNGTMDEMTAAPSAPETSTPLPALTTEQLTQILLAQLLGNQQGHRPRFDTAELDLAPLLDLTQEPAMVIPIRDLALTGT